MKFHVVLHRMAISFLILLAVSNVVTSVRLPFHVWKEIKFQPIANLIIWGVLGWKIWTQPRTWWGFGVGMLMLLGFPARVYLWHRVLASSIPEELGTSRSWWEFVAYEIPVLGAAICCVCLRWIYPHSPAQSD